MEGRRRRRDDAWTRPLMLVACAGWLANALAPFGSWWQMLGGLCVVVAGTTAPPMESFRARLVFGAALWLVVIWYTPLRGWPVPKLAFYERFWGSTSPHEWEHAWQLHKVALWLPLVVAVVDGPRALVAAVRGAHTK